MIFAGLVREYAIPSLSNFNSCDASQLNVRNGAVAMSAQGTLLSPSLLLRYRSQVRRYCVAQYLWHINHKFRTAKKFSEGSQAGGRPECSNRNELEFMRARRDFATHALRRRSRPAVQSRPWKSTAQPRITATQQFLRQLEGALDIWRGSGAIKGVTSHDDASRAEIKM
jgi:hypothetical protein